MLDECKGERFGELLAHFAMLVLRKVVKRRKDLPLVTRALLDSSQEQHHFVPLSIAYKTSLRIHLESRHQLVAQLNHQKRSLDDRDDELTKRRHIVLEALAKHSQEDHSTSLDILKSSWSGDSRWLAVLLSDVPVSWERTSMPNILSSGEKGANNSCLPGESSALMNNLDKRIRKHESRLKEWKIYQSSQLRVNQPQRAPEKGLTSSSVGSWSMNKHQHLRILPTRMEAQGMTHDERSDLLPGHADLLDRMDRELGTSWGFLPRPANTSTNPLHAQSASQPQPNADMEIKGSATSTTVEPVLRTPKKEYEHLFTSSATSTATKLSSRKQHADTSECSWLAESTRGMTASPNSAARRITRPGLVRAAKKYQYENAGAVIDKISAEPRRSHTDVDGKHAHHKSRQSRDSLDSIRVVLKGKHVWSSSPPNSTAQLSLADRTRQSMSLIDRLSDVKSTVESTLGRDRPSKVHSINQFETPQKQSKQQTALDTDVDQHNP